MKEHCVTAFVLGSWLASVRINSLARIVEIICPDMKRLMDITDVMGQQNDGDRFGDFARIILWDFAAQNMYAVGNHVHNVPLTAPSFAIGIFVGVENGHIRVMKPMMRRDRRRWVQRRRIRAPEFPQLIVDFWMIRVMWKSVWILDTILVPRFNFIGDD